MKVSEQVRAARMRTLEEHIAAENDRNLERLLATFGVNPIFVDVPYGESHHGTTGVRSYYDGLLKAAPDFRAEVQRWHPSEDHVVLESLITGSHLGRWRGLPPTGRALRLPVISVFSFDADQRITEERVYYDRATVLRQLGVFHDPDTLWGKIVTVLTHPVTLLLALLRRG